MCSEFDLARDGAVLQQLRAEIRAILPPGWRAEITPDEVRRLLEEAIESNKPQVAP